MKEKYEVEVQRTIADASQFAPTEYPLGLGALLIVQGFSSQVEEHAFEVGFDGFDTRSSIWRSFSRPISRTSVAVTSRQSSASSIVAPVQVRVGQPLQTVKTASH